MASTGDAPVASELLSRRIDRLQRRIEALEARQGKTIHAVLACDDSTVLAKFQRNGRPIIVDRDANAAKNLYRIGVEAFAGRERPAPFCRPSAGAAPAEVGRAGAQ